MSKQASIVSVEQFVEKAFEKFDKDHNGTLEYQEAKQMATDCFKHPSEGISEQEIRGYFEAADLKHDGHITKDELVLFLKKVYKIN